MVQQHDLAVVLPDRALSAGGSTGSKLALPVPVRTMEVEERNIVHNPNPTRIVNVEPRDNHTWSRPRQLLLYSPESFLRRIQKLGPSPFEENQWNDPFWGSEGKQSQRRARDFRIWFLKSGCASWKCPRVRTYVPYPCTGTVDDRHRNHRLFAWSRTNTRLIQRAVTTVTVGAHTSSDSKIAYAISNGLSLRTQKKISMLILGAETFSNW